MEALTVSVEPGAATTVDEAAVGELAAAELEAALVPTAAEGVVVVLIEDDVGYVGGV